jgi:hypothetical protein
MAQKTITAGSPPIVWSTVEEAFTKINANFDEIYATIGSELGSVVDFTTLSTDISPSETETYDLGSPAFRWKDLYLSGTSLYLGNAQITADITGAVNLPSGSTIAGELIRNPAEAGFKTIAVLGQSNIDADTFADTLNVASGNAGITITTNPTDDTITFSNSGILSISGTALQIGANTVNGVTTLTNLGVLSLAGEEGGIGVSASTGNVIITNLGVKRLLAGSGINISPVGGTGNVTIENTAPGSPTFRTIRIDGDFINQVQADPGNLNDILNFISGPGISITGDSATDTITFTNNIDIGNIIFNEETISAANEAVITVEAKDNSSFATAKLRLEPVYGTAQLSAFSNESVDTYTLAGGDFTTGIWQDNGFGNGVVAFTGAQNIGDFFQNTLQQLTPDNVTIIINSEPAFTWNGGTSGAGTDTPGFGTNPIVPSSPITITSIEFRYRSQSFISVNYDNQEIRLDAQNASIRMDSSYTIQMYGDSDIDLQAATTFRIAAEEDINIGTGGSNAVRVSGGDFVVSASDDIDIRGNDSFRLRNESPTTPIRIITDDDDNEYTWAFNADGTVTFPDTTVQTTAYPGPQTSLTGDVVGSVFADNSTVLVDGVNAKILGDIENSLITTSVLNINEGVFEKFQSLVDATGTVTHDCSSGHIFYHTSPDANWTVNLTNLNLAGGYATTVTIVIVQGGTGYYPNALQIEGSAQTINWQSNSTPTPSTNRQDIVSFSILAVSGGYIVFGQLTGF